MKGLIIMAELSKTKVGQEPYRVLAELLSQEYHMPIIELTPNIVIPSDLDLVINYDNVSSQMLNLDQKIKLITWVADVNVSSKGTKRQVKERKQKKDMLFDRSDLIVSGMLSYFKKTYPQHVGKMVFLPKHFGPYSRFCRLPFNKEPKMKCLLSGASHNPYPMRTFVERYGDKKLIDKHTTPVEGFVQKGIPPWKHTGDDYARWLNSYFCCVTSSSIYNCLVGKYFEIPAVGSLLLANETEDSIAAGFVPGVHYVSVTKETVLDRIKKCIKKPVKYDRIRRQGMMFVRENHSIYQRFAKFKRIIESESIR